MTEEQIVEQLYKALQLLEDDCPGLAKMKIMFLIGELEQVMKLVYLQSTIDLIIAQGGIKEVEALGTPELIETTDSKGETGIRYFKFVIE